MFGKGHSPHLPHSHLKNRRLQGLGLFLALWKGWLFSAVYKQIKQSMLYGATVWTTCSADNIKKVLQLQKRAARVILRADTRANSVQLFKKLGWIPFFQEAKINKCSIIYKRLNGDCPGYIEDLLKRNCDVHSRQSRHGATNLVCPHFKRETEGGRTFTISSIRLWNSLNTQLKKVDSISSFKTALFKHFFEINNNLTHFTIS